MPKSGKGACELVRDVGTKQAPAFEAFQGRVDLDRGGDGCAGSAHELLGLGLRGRRPTMRGLELERVELPLVDDQNVGNAGNDAERLEDRGLDRRAPAAGGIMECENAAHSAPGE